MFKKIKEKLLSKNDSEEKLLKKISTLFANSPNEGISEAEKYLMSPKYTNYNEFIADVKKTQKSNCCIFSWSKSTLSARCLDCQLQDNSCICIPCYLAGKHDQHHSYLIGGSGAGNCDCGDPNFWKKEGNCPNHPGPDLTPEVTQMTPENRTKFIQIFKLAYNAALTTKNDIFLIQIFEWINGFISFGDGFRRCVAIAISSAPEKDFISKLQTLEEEPLNSLINLFGKLISDRYFSEKMGTFTLKNYLLLRNLIKSELTKTYYNKKSAPFLAISEYLSFSFHFFNEIPLMYMIKEMNFDWVEFIIKCIIFTLGTVKQTNMDYEKNSDGHIVSQLWYLSKLLDVLIKKDDQHENLQKFVDLYSHLLVDYERLYAFTFPRKKEDESYSPYVALNLSDHLYQINTIFSPKTESSQKNKRFSLDVPFTNLLKFFAKSNDLKPVSLYGKESVPISSFLPLHHFFCCLLSSYSNEASDVIKEMCKRHKFDLQKFCCLASICPLRIMAAIFAPDRFNLLNDASHRQITYLLDAPDESFNIIFSLIQKMLNVADDKEELLSMVTETFGVFDDVQIAPDMNTTDKRILTRLLMDYQNQLEMHQSSILDSSIFIVSLITDYSLGSFNKVLFKRLRVIELLSNEKADAKEIEKYVGEKLSSPVFGDDLQSFAERVSTSNGSFFRLKDQNEFTPFFPVMYRKSRMKILMSYKDKLIPIPDYKIDSESASMINCFNSPTFIYAMFNCLTRNDTLSKQIGLAMFVLAVRNGPKYEIENQLKNPRTIKTDSITELFDYLEKNKKDPTFNPLLLKIKLQENSNETSIIEAAKSMERLGYEAFEKTDLPSILRPKMDGIDDQIQKEKKAKASNLKQALMKEFQNKRSQFSMGGTTSTSQNHQEDNDDDYDDDDDDDDDQSKKGDKKNGSSEIMCNICQTKLEGEVIGFPCLSLPCIFPSLINKKLHNLETSFDELESVFSLSICMHHVHHKCCMSLIKEFKDDRGNRNEEKVYNCMIDRGTRNCFLPLFPESFNFGTETSESLRESVDSFMTTAFKNCSDPTVTIKSYAGAVMMLEVRHRSRPECLDNPTVPALLRNLLLTLYTALKEKIPSGFDSSDHLVKLVTLLINSDSPTSQHKNYVKQIASSIKEDDYLYEFLRRAAIIEDFALKGEIQKRSENKSKSGSKGGFIDWDEVLSFQNLIKRYEIENKGNEIELPLFETIPLPDRFVGLYQPPYNMDIFDTSISKFVDLLTGKIVFFSNHEIEIPGKPEIPHITLYVSQRYHEGMAMFLSLTGPNASDIVISCPAIAKLFNLDGFYVDQFGDIDRGFKRGAILSISKDRLENALDKLLSGDIILY